MIEHGGNLEKLAERAGCAPDELLDFSVNLNPFGPPEGFFSVPFRSMDGLAPYPELHAESLCRLLAEKHAVPETCILFGNGSSELLSLIPRVMADTVRRAVVLVPGYLEYAESCRLAGLPVTPFVLSEEQDFVPDLEQLSAFLKDGDLLFIGNPANPSGVAVEPEKLYALIDSRRDVFFVVDEAFADFSGKSLFPFGRGENLLILRSMTKYYALAGLRMGYSVAPEGVISRMRELQVPWSVGRVARDAAEFLLSLPEKNDSGIADLRTALSDGLRAAGLRVFPSEANYLLVKGPEHLADLLLKKYHIAVRDCSNYPGLSSSFFRVAVRLERENRILLDAIAGALNVPVKARLNLHKKRPALMFQGTCSNAGKSILTAAFCRILLQDGYRPAPFKAQNMALNSYVTPDGGEIGRAQAVQAAACRRVPDVRMNPILLKPESDLGSQVILLGKPIGRYRVREYFAKKRDLWEEVKKAYDSLSSEYDCVVLEGAGSPGEVNLKSSDIVNMRMAEYASSPVVLVGDIDRGGVYASFIGTYATLDPWERSLLCGFAVNKFRGDPGLLADAHAYVERMTGKPVLGVVDYLRDLGLPEEDSVGFSFSRPIEREPDALDIAVIHLGHISNFTDFAALELEPDARMRIVRSASEFGSPDLILLPGTKSTAADLEQLRKSGLADRIIHSSVPVAGICGGLQIMGTRLTDPDGIESSAGSEISCLNLLPLTTVMRNPKTVRHSTASFSGEAVLSGYEIHNGVTHSDDPELETAWSPDGRPLAFRRGRFFATYLHGVFDDDSFRRDFLNRIRVEKGMPEKTTLTHFEIEHALDALADHVRSRIDVPALYRRMGLK